MTRIPVPPAVLLARLSGAIVAVRHHDAKAAQELLLGVLAALASVRPRQPVRVACERVEAFAPWDAAIVDTLAEVRSLAIGDAVGADSVECDGRRLR